MLTIATLTVIVVQNAYGKSNDAICFRSFGVEGRGVDTMDLVKVVPDLNRRSFIPTEMQQRNCSIVKDEDKKYPPLYHRAT